MILDDVQPLIDAGFALHWLKSREKAPIGNDWSTKPVATAELLRSTYRDGVNVGVRLGEFSRVAGGYLHVLDQDVNDPETADEANAARIAMLPGVDWTQIPTVISGSGGAARHFHIILPTPFKSRKLLRSPGFKMVFDPAKGREVKKHDWELDFFGTGKQVVLPPSIHPSGNPYVWERQFDFADLEFGGGPFVSAVAIEAAGAIVDEGDDGSANTDRLGLTLAESEHILADLPLDRWCEDRDGWKDVGMALKHEHGDDGYEIWCEFSRQSAKFDAKNQQSVWKSFKGRTKRPIRMATLLAAAKDARFSAADFDDLDDEPSPPASNSDFDELESAPAPAPGEPKGEESCFDLTPEEKKADAAVSAALEWNSLLDVNEEGGIKPTLHNLELILKNDPRFAGLAQLNDFTHEVVQRSTPGIRPKRRAKEAKPTKQLTGHIWLVEDTRNGDLWSDDRDFAIRSVIEAPRTQGGFGMKVTDRDLKAAVSLSANDHTFHPIREYLEALTWDGEERVERLWVDYVNAPDDEYHREVARLMMTAAVARIYEPGHKFDFATILEGLQGKRKSTLIEVLGRRWFAELNGDFHDPKQMVELMQGAWIMEIPELTGFGRADVRAIKAFISGKRDKVRLAYARRAGQYPRQVIFLGSTNDREYLRDDTGGRRFWPVECRLANEDEINIAGLEINIDQLWAEAVSGYRAMRVAQPVGTLPLYLRGIESRSIAARLQESRRVETASDTLAGRIEAWLDKPVSSGDFEQDQSQGTTRNETCTLQIWVECLGRDEASFKGPEQTIVNSAISKVNGWYGDGSQMRFPRYGKQRVFYRGGIDGKLERMGLGLVTGMPDDDFI